MAAKPDSLRLMYRTLEFTIVPCDHDCGPDCGCWGPKPNANHGREDSNKVVVLPSASHRNTGTAS